MGRDWGLGIGDWGLEGIGDEIFPLCFPASSASLLPHLPLLPTPLLSALLFTELAESWLMNG